MNIIYDRDDNLVTITCVERVKNKEIKHKYTGTPLVIQRHPLTEDVIRVYFEGNRPNWLDHIKKVSNSIANNSVNIGNGGLGWWISRWNLDSSIIISPTIQGALYMIIDRIPEEFSDLKKHLRDNIEIATMNITYDQSQYNDLGLVYKPEEINGVAGAIYLDSYPYLVQRRDQDRIDFLQRFADSRFPKLIEELTIPLEYSEEFLLSQADKNDEWIEDEVPINQKPAATHSDDELEVDWEEDTLPCTTQTENESEVETSEFDGEWQEAELPAPVKQDSNDVPTDTVEASEGEWEEGETPNAYASQESSSEEDKQLEGEWEEDEVPITTDQQESDTGRNHEELASECQDDIVSDLIPIPELKVADSVNKKSDAMVGQLLLF